MLFPHTLYDYHSDLQRVKVRKTGDLRVLLSDGSALQGAHRETDPDQLVFRYQEALLLHRLFMEDVSTFISIGVGTGTAMRTMRSLYPHCSLLGVDIDKVIPYVAVSYFDCPSDPLTRFHIKDGSEFLEEIARTETDAILSGKPFVFLDAFYRESIPESFTRPRFYQALRKVIGRNGLFAINVISPVKKGRESLEYLAILCELLERFEQVWTVPTSRNLSESQNILLFATDLPLADRDIRYSGASQTRIRTFRRWMYQN